MQTVQEKNGDLTFVLDADDAEMIGRFRDQAQNNVDHEVLASMLDHFGYIGNARFMPIMPVDVGALTDAPMFTNELDIEDNGKHTVKGDVWYFADYQIEDFSDLLQHVGKVTFKKVLH